MEMSSHDFTGNWYCTECGIFAGDPMAKLACRPSTDDSGLPPDTEPREPIDYSAITRGIVG